MQIAAPFGATAEHRKEDWRWIVNLTPHAINIVGGPTFPPSGTVARCAVDREQIAVIDGVPINRIVFGAVHGLPDPMKHDKLQSFLPTVPREESIHGSHALFFWVNLRKGG